MKAGRIGIINAIFVDDDPNKSVAYGIEISLEGWDGPYWNGYVCKLDEIELIERNKHP